MKIKMNRDQLIQYMIDNKDNNKGIIIVGNYGVGKTLITEHLTYSNYNKPGRVNKIIWNIGLKVADRSLDRITALTNDHYFKETMYLIDDVGSEEIVKDYGIEFNYVKEYIYEAYDNYTKGRKNKLVMTSNLNINQLTERYGDRVISRINEFCDIILLEDTDLRISENVEYSNGLVQRLKDLHDQYFNIPLMRKKQIKTN